MTTSTAAPVVPDPSITTPDDPPRSSTSSITSPSTTAPTSTTSTAAVDTGDVDGFATTSIRIGDRDLLVAVADAGVLRRRGLMGVVDLGDLDGMLFVMGGTVQSSFTMRNTLIPLHVAFFDGAGALVDVLEMIPCESEPCPSYRPSAEYEYAVEVPLGRFDDLDEADSLSIKG